MNATDSLGLDPVVELDMPEGDAELTGLRAAGGNTTGARALTVPPGTVQQRLRPAIYVYELPTWLAQAFEARAPRCLLVQTRALTSLLLADRPPGAPDGAGHVRRCVGFMCRVTRRN